MWLDHSGNYLRFMEDWETIYHNGVDELDESREKAKKEKTQKEKEEAKCPKCGALWPGGSDTCSHCGHVRQRRNKVVSVAGEMQELMGGKQANRSEWWAMCCWKVQNAGWSPGRAAHTYREKFGSWPRGMDNLLTLPPSAEFEKFVKYRLIAYLKGRKR